MLHKEKIEKLVNLMVSHDDEFVKENISNKALCKKCKGKCCKNLGCAFSPRQFNLSKDETNMEENNKIVLEILNTGIVSIDWWEDETPQYFLRIRNKNGSRIDPSWGGCCMLLDEMY